MPFSLKDSLGIKLLIIISVALALIIPVFMIRALVDERQGRAQDAEATIERQWGGSLTVAGPVLSIPFREETFLADGKKFIEDKIARILPKTLDTLVTADTQVRTLGIFPVSVFTSKWNLKGTFSPPDFQGTPGAKVQVFWNQATVTIEMKDFSVLESRGTFIWDKTNLPMEIKDNASGLLNKQGLGAVVSTSGWVSGDKNFSIDIEARGSGNLSMAPLGDQNTFSITSKWPTPLFTGGLLPHSRQIGPDGFTALWKSFSTVRGLPSVWIDNATVRTRDLPQTQGVTFNSGVDNYLQSDRALKYGFLFILLPFALLFLLEVFTTSRFHPLQYLMVGLADLVFYLVLVALGEHLDFNLAFLLAAGASTALIVFYTSSITAKPLQGMIMAPVLSGLYVYLFAALQSEDYALLIGTIGLFLIVALIMILTRKIDWFKMKGKKVEE